MDIVDVIEKIIDAAIANFDGDCTAHKEDCFRDLLSIGELIDRLTIVNIKNFQFQDNVLKSSDDKFKADGVSKIFSLALERSKLKNCIDEKFLEYISGRGTFNPELKRYEGL